MVPCYFVTQLPKRVKWGKMREFCMIQLSLLENIFFD